MRDSIKKFIEETFILEYKLPLNKIDKSSITKLNDYFYDVSDSNVSESIYNSIIDYCLNDIEIDLLNLDQNQMFAINNRLRYDNEAELDTQIKYGFFGETLLNIVLNVMFKSNKIIAKGHFYSPIEKSEPKGYDSFHFFEENENIQFWFGESKMHTSIHHALNSVFSNINRALSNSYYQDNLRAIISKEKYLDETEVSQLFKDLTEILKNNSMKKVMDEIKKNKISVVYPILISYNDNSKDFTSKMEKTMRLIERKLNDFDISNEIDAEIMFILIPVNNIINIKKDVLTWISKQKPII